MQRLLWVSPIRTTLIAAAVGLVLSYPMITVIWLFNQLSTTPGTLKWPVLIILPVAISLCASVFAVRVARASGLDGPRALREFADGVHGPAAVVDEYQPPGMSRRSTLGRDTARITSIERSAPARAA